MTSFLVAWFAYFVGITKGYQSEKFKCCKLSGSSFMQEFKKHNDDVIMTSLNILGFAIFRFLSYLNQILQRFL